MRSRCFAVTYAALMAMAIIAGGPAAQAQTIAIGGADGEMYLEQALVDLGVPQIQNTLNHTRFPGHLVVITTEGMLAALSTIE